MFVFFSTTAFSFILFLVLIFLSFPYTCYSPTYLPFLIFLLPLVPPPLTFLFPHPSCLSFLFPSLLFRSSNSYFFFLFILFLLVPFLLFFHPSFPSTFMVILPPPLSYPSLTELMCSTIDADLTQILPTKVLTSTSL